MKRSYTYATSVAYGGDVQTAEFDVEVEFTVSWGAPEQGPTYSCGGQPADPDGIDDINVLSIDGKPRPWGFRAFEGPGWLSDQEAEDSLIEKLESQFDDMLAHAYEQEAERYNEAAEARYDARRTGAPQS